MISGRSFLMLGVLAAAVVSVTPALSQEPGKRPRVPVVIGGNYDWDACGGSGVIAGLDPAGDGFLAVRSGPGAKHAELDRLYNGEEVYLCADSGRWIGIVYTRRGRSCNVSSPWPVRQAYTGPCKSGWVHQNWVRQTAG
jgi:hypothetical protein